MKHIKINKAMKKNYLKPNTEILIVETQGMLAGSDAGFSFDGDTGTGVLNETTATGEAMSKGGFDAWGADE